MFYRRPIATCEKGRGGVASPHLRLRMYEPIGARGRLPGGSRRGSHGPKPYKFIGVMRLHTGVALLGEAGQQKYEIDKNRDG